MHLWASHQHQQNFLPVQASKNLSLQDETPLFEARLDDLLHAEPQQILTNRH